MSGEMGRKLTCAKRRAEDWKAKHISLRGAVRNVDRRLRKLAREQGRDSVLGMELEICVRILEGCDEANQ